MGSFLGSGRGSPSLAISSSRRARSPRAPLASARSRVRGTSLARSEPAALAQDPTS
ncbi:MAG: hypothetical protein RXP91_03945 [Nitrososphaeria archaeon]